jgi:hypothetical protein
MSIVAVETIQQDELALAVASAVTVANQAALAQGTAVADSLITINEERDSSGRSWRIHYGPRDYISQRGGDLIVVVEENTGKVKQILHGQ